MKENRAIFLLLGTFISVSAVFVNSVAIISGKFPTAPIMIAMGIMCFCLAFLSPHFAEKDERAQKIRERGVYISYFWGLGYAIVLMIALNPNSSFQLNSYETISLYLSLYIATVFLSMAYYARKY